MLAGRAGTLVAATTPAPARPGAHARAGPTAARQLGCWQLGAGRALAACARAPGVAHAPRARERDEQKKFKSGIFLIEKNKPFCGGG